MDVLIFLVVGGGSVVCYFANWFYFWRLASAKIQSSGPGIMLCLAGCIVPVLGVFIGAWYLLAGPTASRQAEQTTTALSDMPAEKIVDLIDENSCASVIASNSAWLKNNWHSMTDAQKIQWVVDRREGLLNYLSEASDAPSFITALQRADKEITRKAS